MMPESSPILAGRLNRTALTWVLIAVLAVTPMETIALDSRAALMTLPVRAGSLLTILFLLRTDRIGPIGCGRWFLGQGLVTMVAWSFLLEPDPNRVTVETIAYGTILSIFALMIAPRRVRRWWAAAVVGVVLIPAAVHLIPDNLILFLQACAVLIVHGAAVAVLDVHTNKAEEAGAMASIDPLTGLLNRRAMLRRLDEQIGLTEPEGQESSLLIIDLDHFKAINDTRGHLAGDAVLIEVAQAMQSMVRPSDTVCRWGGEEFVVLLPASDLSAALRTADRLRHVIGETGVTASVGVADSRDGDSASEWIRRADQALYSAKSEGRNRVSSNVVYVGRQQRPQPAPEYSPVESNRSSNSVAQRT